MLKDSILYKATRDAYGHALIELAERNPDIVVFDADLSRSTRTDWFQDKFPHRFYNMGIAEANMIGVAAGISMTGIVPFVTTYSIFIGRAWDQIRQAVAFSNTNVKIVATHAGLAASYDGGSHQGLEDIAILRSMPGMTILSPADYYEARQAVFTAAEYNGPVYIRLGKQEVPVFTDKDRPFHIGRYNRLTEGTDIVVFATGNMVYQALLAAAELKNKGISVEVINAHTIKPLDCETVSEAAHRFGCIVTAEEHNRIGGLFGAISEFVSENIPIPIIPVAMNDFFGETGSWEQLLEKYGLTKNGIIESIYRALEKRF